MLIINTYAKSNIILYRSDSATTSQAQMEYLKQKGPQSGQSAYDQIKDFLLKLFKERPPQKRVYSEFEELTQ